MGQLLCKKSLGPSLEPDLNNTLVRSPRVMSVRRSLCFRAFAAQFLVALRCCTFDLRFLLALRCCAFVTRFLSAALLALLLSSSVSCGRLRAGGLRRSRSVRGGLILRSYLVGCARSCASTYSFLCHCALAPSVLRRVRPSYLPCARCVKLQGSYQYVLRLLFPSYSTFCLLGPIPNVPCFPSFQLAEHKRRNKQGQRQLQGSITINQILDTSISSNIFRARFWDRFSIGLFLGTFGSKGIECSLSSLEVQDSIGFAIFLSLVLNLANLFYASSDQSWTKVSADTPAAPAGCTACPKRKNGKYLPLILTVRRQLTRVPSTTSLTSPVAIKELVPYLDTCRICQQKVCCSLP